MTATLPPDPYKILGVAQDAQIPEIRSAHRKLVLKCHPDKVQDPTLKAQKQDEFQKVQQAYELLSNEKERQRYDDKSRLAELRRQMQAKANSSAPRTTQTYFEVRTPEPRPSSFKSSSGSPSAKHPFSRSYEGPTGPPIFEQNFVRREKSYESKSKREDRDRATERSTEKERNRERERENRRKVKEAEEAVRRAEEKVRKSEKKARDKDRKRDADEKKRHTKPYIEDDLDELPRSEKKKSSKKHEERRDRSAHREEVPVTPVGPPPMPQLPKEEVQYKTATEYIRIKNGLAHPFPPAAPTPPMPAGQSSPFTPPAENSDDEVRRSSGKSRRGSAHKKPSREVLEDPDIINVSPGANKAAKAATATLSGSPPRREFARQATMPDTYTRPIPSMARASTFSGAYQDLPSRGRDRSRLHAQVSADSLDDGDYERRHSRKHRSSKKQRSPEPREYIRAYKVEPGTNRTVAQDTYARSYESPQTFSYYPPNYGGSVRVDESHHTGHRSSSGYDGVPINVKTSRSYNLDDINYSNHYKNPSTYEEYGQYAY